MKSIDQNKLFQALRSLSLPELSRFQQYVDSPFFNHSQRLRDFLQQLILFAPDFHDPGLTREFLYEKLFPGEDFHAQKLREQLSFLYRLLKGFFIQIELQSKEYEPKTMLLAQLRQRQLTQAFHTEAKRIEKGLTASHIRDAEYHWTHYQMAYETANLSAQKELRTYDASLAQAMNHLDVWYYIQKLRGSNELLNRQHILHTDEEIYGMELLLASIAHEHHPLTDTPAIQIYREIWVLMQTGVESSYERLKDLLETYAKKFLPKESRLMYKNAQNYCIRQINAGNTRFEKELLSLYKQQLYSGLILIGGKLAHTDFKNIVTVGLREREFQWVKEFIQSYQDYVSMPHRENVVNFCWASFMQATSQTKEAIRILRTVEFTDAYYQLSSRHLLLRCYYEQKDWEALGFLINNFQHFLKRNKEISGKNRKNHLNFLSYFRKLLALQEKKRLLSRIQWNDRVERLKISLQHASFTAHLGWLREQIQQL